MLRIAPAAYADSGAFSCPALQPAASPCNEREINMLAMFMMAIHAMCRTLIDPLPGVDIQCHSRRTGINAAVPGKSPDPIPGLPLEFHAGGAASRRGGAEHGPAPP